MDDQDHQTMLAPERPSTFRTLKSHYPTPKPPYGRPSADSSTIKYPARLLDRGHVGSTGRGVLIGVLSAFGSALFVIFILGLIYFLRFTGRGRILLDRIGRPGDFDDEQAFAREEAEALEDMDDLQRAEYMRAKGMYLHTLLLIHSLILFSLRRR